MKEYTNAEEVNKKQKRRVKYVIGLKAFIVGGVITSIAFLYNNLRTSDENDFSMSEISKELSIHSGHEFTDDGKQVNPYLPHGCEVPLDEEETQFIDRVANRMALQYPESAIEEVRIAFSEMYHGDRTEYEEALERLDELEDNLEKGDDGKYHYKEVRSTKTR